MRYKIISFLEGYPLHYDTLLEQFEGYVNEVYFWAYFLDDSLVCFYGETFRCKIVTSFEEFRSFIKDNFTPDETNM